MKTLEQLRTQIDQLDTQIVELLEQRAAVTDQVATLKNQSDAPLTDPKRETDQLQRISAQVDHSVLKYTIHDIYRSIITQTKRARILTKHTQLPFQRVGIIGLGLMGGSVLAALRARSADVTIHALDHPSAHEALRDGALDAIAPDIPTLVQTCDLIIVAAPLLKIEAVFQAIAETDPEDPTIVIDIGSVKESIAHTAQTLSKPNLEFLPTHPMAGSDQSGYSAADPLLFVDRTWVITPHSGSSEGTQLKVRQFTQFLGANPVICDAREHDTQVAAVSHLVFLVATYLYAFIAASYPNAIRFAGPGFWSTTRLAQGNPAMHDQIVSHNHVNVSSVWQNWQSYLQSHAQKLPDYQFFYDTKSHRDQTQPQS